MRAVGFTEFGGPSVLHVIDDLPVPEPGPGQVLVHVAAATVNPTDIGFRLGGRKIPDGVTPPYIPGAGRPGVHEGARVAELADLAAKGVLTLRLAEAMPTQRAPEAHARLEAGGVRGRLVLIF